MKILPGLVLACLGLPFSAEATIVWTDDYSRAALSYDYPGGTVGNDYSSVSSGSPTIISSQYLNFTDNATGSQLSAHVLTDQFSARPVSDGDQLTVTYDFRVNSLVGTNASVTRLSIMNGSAAGGGEAFTIGFTYGAWSGGFNANTLGFFWGTAANTGPTLSRGIGIGATGFDFGLYDSANATNNDTNLLYYRISYSMAEGSTGVSGTITRLDGSGAPTSDVANFNGTMASALDWSTTGSDGFKVTTGSSGTGSFDFDNISIDIVPEPSTLGLAMLGGLIGLRRRR